MKLSERLQALSYLSPDEFKELEAYETEVERVTELEDLIKIYQEYSILEMPREVNQKFHQLIEKLDLTF